MKNKLLDLNNHLFEQLERLNDDELSDEGLAREAQRTDSMVKIADQIIGTAHVAIQAAKLVNEAGGNYHQMLPMIGGSDKINEDQPALAPPKGKKS